MDIRLKNIKYSMGAKAAAVILIWLCFLSVVGSGVFLLYNGEIASSESYFETYSFKFEFERLVNNTVEVNIKLKSVEGIKASGEAENVIAENIEHFYRLKDELSRMVNYIYYIKNSPTGEVITNITASEPMVLIKKQPVNSYINQWKSTYEFPRYWGGIENKLLGTDYEVYAAIQEPLEQGDAFYDNFMAYSETKVMSSYAFILLFVSLIVLIIAAIYLAFVAGRMEKGGEIVFSGVDKIYTDV
ncbi:MAG TPA: sensor histidine kinase, partial [Patescibacteria group bacterium]|nr:sensor histidine kinase [Patescibacteria group bacterium]